VHVLALGVLPAFRRRGLATQLLRTAAASLRALAATAPQVPAALVTPQSPTRVHVNVARSDGNARAFWSHVGMHEEEGAARREPWTVGWRDVVSVAGPVLSAA
jgi:ribosomal protein S18 acetylase RimI-like enzyme